MPAKKNSSGVPKNAVRCAVVTAATVATLMGAQTLAFSQSLKDLQDQQAQALVVSTQLSDQQVAALTSTDSQGAILPTLVPSPTSTFTVTPTTLVIATKQSIAATQVSATSTPAPSQTPSPSSTKAILPTATATKVVVATKQPTQIVVAVKQPAPRTQSSKR